jgi:hypothetical protein
MDFTLKKYIELQTVMVHAGYQFQSFSDILEAPANRFLVLRHDVDLMPDNSLQFARLQAEQGIRGVYYFRAVRQSWDPRIIREINGLGHEIGYHYECMTTCNGDVEASCRDFQENLFRLRDLVDVKTICMHGSPMSKFDSKEMWKYYDYRSFGIIGEPYFDVQFDKVLYLTDTGRRWDGAKVNVRDKTNGGLTHAIQNTDQLIGAFRTGELPDKLMITFHPQRWNNNIFLWTKELAMQSIKNVVKQWFFVNR